MSNAIIAELEAFVQGIKDKFSTERKEVENDVKAIGSSALSYIEKNGLQDLYQIALTLVGAMLPGASWSGVLAAIVVQAKADGVAIVEGAEGVVAAQAQADLIALGKSAGLPAAQ